MASPKKSERNSSCDWTLLPKDILDEITDKFDDIKDYIRFGAVCKSWLSFSQTSYKHKHSLHTNQQLPLLLVPIQGHQQKRGLYSITKGEVCNKVHVHLPFKRCCGSSHGWLFFVENFWSLELNLINPFQEHDGVTMKIKLPPIQVFPDEQDLLMNQYGVYKAILSKDPFASPNDYEVMAIYGDKHKLAHYNSGDKFWTFPRSENAQFFEDVIFYKGDIYCVDITNLIVKVTLRSKKILNKQLNFNNCSPFYLQFKNIIKMDLSYYYFGRNYLVETYKGDLVLVRRDYLQDYELDGEHRLGKKSREKLHERMRLLEAGEEAEVIKYSYDMPMDFYEDEYAKPHMSIYFRVYKLHCSSEKMRMVRFKTLHGETFFLGDNHSISVSASDFAGIVPNAIYYTDDNSDYHHNIKFGSCDTAIFNLVSESFDNHFIPNFSAKGMPPPIFIVPSYRCNSRSVV